MTTYLVIITTVLVLTQVIRVTQNAFQLKGQAKFDEKNQKVLELFEEMAIDVRAIKNYLEEE